MADIFRSFFLGGFECSSHRRRDGKRLDVVADSRHDIFASQDYARCTELGIKSVREGIRWPRIEKSEGIYDFSIELSRIRAARESGVQVVWDLLHYGWPDYLDVFSPDFVSRFGLFSRAFAQLLDQETDEVPFYAPVNEISFLAWAGGATGYVNPFGRRKARALKAQLVRAAIEATEEVWSVSQSARIVQVDPVINIVADPARKRDKGAATRYTLAQYEAWDMLAGIRQPELGGNAKYIDIVGINLYDRNQWIHNGPTLRPGDDLYKPFRDILRDVHARYDRPVLVAETGTEGDARPQWLGYIASEVAAALEAKVPVEGICLYPILNHPGWDDERHLHCGLWDYADEHGRREVFGPLERELRIQQEVLAAARSRLNLR